MLHKHNFGETMTLDILALSREFPQKNLRRHSVLFTTESKRWLQKLR